MFDSLPAVLCACIPSPPPPYMAFSPPLAGCTAAWDSLGGTRARPPPPHPRHPCPFKGPYVRGRRESVPISARLEPQTQNLLMRPANRLEKHLMTNQNYTPKQVGQTQKSQKGPQLSTRLLDGREPARCQTQIITSAVIKQHS